MGSLIAPQHPSGSRARRPGSRRLALAVATFVAAAAAAFGIGTAVGSATNSPTRQAGSESYGGLPSWLPKAKNPVGRIVNASATHPLLQGIEGETVAVRLARGSVEATAVGPAFPAAVSQHDQDAPEDPVTAPCTFTVTLAAARGVVPIAANAFSLLDEHGGIHPLRVTSAGGGPPPAAVRPGRTIMLTIKATLAEGEYDLRWAPDGPRVLVGWQASLELD